MQFLKQNSILLGLSMLYIILACYLTWIDLSFLTLFPIGLMAIYFAIFYTEKTFLAIAFLTPLSINIEEYTDSFGLYLPTEPLLFGLMIWFLMKQLKSNIILKELWQNPIIWAVGFYLTWIFITSITSVLPAVSFKFLLSRIWFFIPLLVFGPTFFIKRKNVIAFIWLFCLAMVIAIIYTLMVHSTYGFGEKEGHWVMWPFFKDHTIYGSTVAFITPLIFGLYFSKKHTPLIQLVLIGLIMITLLGLFFSYTRAAWLSVIASILVLITIKLRIKFIYLAFVGGIAGIVLLFSWDNIQMEMERNKFEHTTEEFGEKLQSATNVTTDASNLERLNRWSCAIEMFKERPFLGFGPGTYAFEYARFQEPENLTIISTNFGDMGNAHSEYLGPLSEMGVFGLLAMLAIVASIFYKSISLYIKWPKEDSEMRVLFLAMIMSLVTYFVHGTLNNYLDTDKAAVPIWGICAIFIAQEIYLKSSALPKERDSNN
jgi:putative inorganic carbon (HCO3(-)) transporter